MLWVLGFNVTPDMLTPLWPVEIAAEAQKTSTAAMYDLAIAKIVMQIQHDETPKYDSAFIALGYFHVEMAFFKSVGKYNS